MLQAPRPAGEARATSSRGESRTQNLASDRSDNEVGPSAMLPDHCSRSTMCSSDSPTGVAFRRLTLRLPSGAPFYGDRAPNSISTNFTTVGLFKYCKIRTHLNSGAAGGADLTTSTPRFLVPSSRADRASHGSFLLPKAGILSPIRSYRSKTHAVCNPLPATGPRRGYSCKFRNCGLFSGVKSARIRNSQWS